MYFTLTKKEGNYVLIFYNGETSVSLVSTPYLEKYIVNCKSILTSHSYDLDNLTVYITEEKVWYNLDMLQENVKCHYTPM